MRVFDFDSPAAQPTTAPAAIQPRRVFDFDQQEQADALGKLKTEAEADPTGKYQYLAERWNELGRAAVQSNREGIAKALNKPVEAVNEQDGAAFVQGQLPLERKLAVTKQFEQAYPMTRFIRQREKAAQDLATVYIDDARRQGINPENDPDAFQQGMHRHIHQKLAEQGLNPSFASQFPIQFDPQRIGAVKPTEVGQIEGLLNAAARGVASPFFTGMHAAELGTSGLASAYDILGGTGGTGGPGADVSYNPFRAQLQAQRQTRAQIEAGLPQSTAAKRGDFLPSMLESGTELGVNLALLRMLPPAAMATMVATDSAAASQQNLYELMKKQGADDAKAQGVSNLLGLIVGAADSYLMTRVGGGTMFTAQGTGVAPRMRQAVINAFTQLPPMQAQKLVQDAAQLTATGQTTESWESFMKAIPQEMLGGAIMGAFHKPSTPSTPEDQLAKQIATQYGVAPELARAWARSSFEAMRQGATPEQIEADLQKQAEQAKVQPATAAGGTEKQATPVFRGNEPAGDMETSAQPGVTPPRFLMAGIMNAFPRGGVITGEALTQQITPEGEQLAKAPVKAPEAPVKAPVPGPKDQLLETVAKLQEAQKQAAVPTPEEKAAADREAIAAQHPAGTPGEELVQGFRERRKADQGPPAGTQERRKLAPAAPEVPGEVVAPETTDVAAEQAAAAHRGKQAGRLDDLAAVHQAVAEGTLKGHQTSDADSMMALNRVREGMNRQMPKPAGGSWTVEHHRPSGGEEATADALAQRLGRKLVVASTDNPVPGGTIDTSDPRTIIYFRGAKSDPVLRTLGHELVHSVSRVSKDIYKRIIDVAMRVDPTAIEREAKDYMRRLGNAQAAGHGVKQVMEYLRDHPEALSEEGAANIMGAALGSREFHREFWKTDPDLFTKLKTVLFDYIKRVESALTGVRVAHKPEMFTELAKVVRELQPLEDAVTVEGTGAKPAPEGQAAKVAAPKERPVEVGPAEQADKAIRPQSPETAALFERALNNKLTEADRKLLGTENPDAAGKMREALVPALQGKKGEGAQDDAMAQLAASFMGILRRKASRMLAAAGTTERKAVDERMPDMLQAAFASMAQIVRGQRRRPTGMDEAEWAKEQAKNPNKIGSYDPEKGDLYSFFVPQMEAAMHKTAFTKRVAGEQGEQLRVAEETQALPVSERGEELTKGKEPTPEQAAIAKEELGLLETLPKAEATPDLVATLKSRGMELEGQKGDQMIVRLRPTGKAVEPSQSPDLPNLARVGREQLEVYKADDQWFERPFGGETYRAVRGARAGELDKLAASGALYPSVTEINKVVREGGGGEEAVAAPVWSINKIGPTGDEKGIRALLKKALKEPVGAKTIGRPELANPATQEPGRRFVDVIDELRKKAGIPAPKSDTITEGAAKYLASAKRDEIITQLKDAAAKNQPLNDVHTLAASKIVAEEAFNAVRTNNSQKLMDAVEIVNAYRDVRTNTARALRIARDPLKTPAERRREFLFNELVEPTPQQAKKLADPNTTPAERAEITKEQVRVLTELKEKLKGQGIDLDALSDAELGKYEIFMRAIRTVATTKATGWDAAYEWWVNAVLSSPKTQAANALGNFASLAWEYTAQRTTEALINTLAGERPGAASLGELPHIWKAVIPAVGRAAKMMFRSFANEGPVFEDEFGGTGRGDFDPDKIRMAAIPGRTGEVVRLPTRTLLAVDEFFKSMSAQLEVAAQAHRIAKGYGYEGDKLALEMRAQMDDLNSEAWDSARSKALELTFKQKPGPLAKALLGMRRNVPGSRYLLPFIITPANIISMGMRKSPLGSLRMLYKLGQQGFVAMQPGKKEWTYTTGEGIHDLAEQALAWGATFALHGLVTSGRLTGSAGNVQQETEGEREFKRRNRPAMSIKLGDKWYSYERIEPLATSLSAAVNLLEAWSEAGRGRRSDLAATEMIRKMVNITRDKTFLKGIGDIMRALDNPTDEIPRMASDFASSWVPNIVRSSVREADPQVRDTKIVSNGVNWIKEMGKTTLYKAGLAPIIPGLNPPPKVDLWGRSTGKEGSDGHSASDFLYRLTVPIAQQKTDRQTIPDRVILNWNNQHPDDPFYPSPPPRVLERGVRLLTSGQERRYEIKKADYEAFCKEAGQLAFSSLQQQKFDSIDQPTKRDIEVIRRVLAATRGATAKKLFGVPAMNTMQVEERRQAGLVPAAQ